MTYEEAQQLTSDERTAGIVVDGNLPPFGGSWSYDPGTNQLTLVEEPTQ
jgi:hypothetical protein